MKYFAMLCSYSEVKTETLKNEMIDLRLSSWIVAVIGLEVVCCFQCSKLYGDRAVLLWCQASYLALWLHKWVRFLQGWIRQPPHPTYGLGLPFPELLDISAWIKQGREANPDFRFGGAQYFLSQGSNTLSKSLALRRSLDIRTYQ